MYATRIDELLLYLEPDTEDRQDETGHVVRLWVVGLESEVDVGGVLLHGLVGLVGLALHHDGQDHWLLLGLAAVRWGILLKKIEGYEELRAGISCSFYN